MEPTKSDVFCQLCSAKPPRSEAFIRGSEEAMKQFKASEHKDDAYAAMDLINPFQRGTDEWEGFEAILYDLTQK